MIEDLNNLYQVYIDGKYYGCVEAEDKRKAADLAIEKFPVKISSKLELVRAFVEEEYYYRWLLINNQETCYKCVVKVLDGYFKDKVDVEKAYEQDF